MNTVELNRRHFIKRTGLATAGLAFLQQTAGAEDRPNILWITAEDLSPHLGCYGDPYAITPNLDQLAQQGIRYNHAYATAPLCTPARSSIITGVFACTMGTQHLRGEMPLSSNLHCFPEFLREAGYYCTNNVKEDYNFVAPKNCWDESSAKAHWRNRKPGQPFFSVFNFMTTHQSQTRYNREELEKVNQKLAPEERHDPSQAPLPPYYPDTPDVRTNVAVFHTQVTLMDKQVKEILDQMEEDGLADNTIVFFYGDHGDGLPRGKRWLHDTGMRVPLIIRFPKKYQNIAPAKPGSEIDQFVSFVDFAPTVLSLAGIPPKDYMQGKAFLGQHKSSEREYVFGIRDRVDEVYECNRSIREKRYHYIRNFMPHRERMQRSFFSELTPIRQELRRLDKEGALKGHETWLMADTIPIEELYDTEKDPWELNNLADDSNYRDIVQSLHKKLLDWMIEIRDMSLFPETEMIARAEGSMPYDFGQNLEQSKFQEIVKVADLVGRGPKHLETLQTALSSSEAAVRYWAATGLAALGKQAQPAKEELINALQDPAASVRFTAAEALCSIGEEEKALPVLRTGLLDKNVRNQLHASHVLMQTGEKAKPAFPEMKIALEQLKDHPDIGWYTRENLQYMMDTYK